MDLSQPPLRIAVIGAGISGMGASWLLSQKHNVTVYEAGPNLGGHANTVDVLDDGKTIPVDTGFIVCNDRNYPNFLALMKAVGVTLHATDMSFGVSMDGGGFEYAGSDKLSELFAQPGNILRPRFWRMLKELLRFYKATNGLAPEQVGMISLRDYLREHNYDETFLRDHILPMAAAVWSTPSEKVGDFPLKSFLRFCQNHGLLQVSDRPQWYTVPGGSRTYVNAVKEHSGAQYLTSTAVNRIIRTESGVLVFAGNDVQQYDRILIATHANTALRLLEDADPLETEILSSFSYAPNQAVLHSDTQFMPKRRKAWSSWNYLHGKDEDQSSLSVTYWMNRLQPLDTDKPMFVTLNPASEPDPALVHYTTDYEHPIFDMKTLEAQLRLGELMGHRNIWYAGAHFGYGFHEDGLQSGLHAAEQMGDISRPWITPDMNNRILMLDAENTAQAPLHSVKAEAV
ncbi:NAD/FAD-binding protein [Kordiimonas sediminis]|uniref:NAD/FAD-binding protein n=1 Tax=Kordiimonas sediminis TaxID=1735581 RepID=A0A919AK87_9PROT|nr:FAD-dependent oxidoreductase [Kordiimonas sediminis]GHF11461.1 NAD/FAD-binding protein [Kordiimonas sediminis]